jgi:hypothetical protein
MLIYASFQPWLCRGTALIFHKVRHTIWHWVDNVSSCCSVCRERACTVQILPELCETVLHIKIPLKIYLSIVRGFFYNILIEIGIPVKPVILTKMCLNETCCRAWVGKYFSDVFPVKNGLKQRDALSPLLSNLTCVCPCIVIIRGEENQLDATQ